MSDEKSASADSQRGWLMLAGSALDRRVLLRLLQEYSSPTELLAASDAELTQRFQLSRNQIDALRRVPPPATIDKQLASMEKHGIRMVPIGDPVYPRNLFEVEIPPPVLFVKGTLLDEDALSVGLVGSRRATTYGAEVARRLATDFAPLLTVVSGAALGIDSVVHEVALNHGGRPLAVLGCGIDVNYPAGNKALRERIASEGGALISAYPPGTSPLRGHFPARNVILAGLSLAVVVVEASATSGALVTARSAGDEGRPVYAVPGDITRRNSAGANALIRDGAILCTSAGDVLADMEAHLTSELARLRQRRSAARQAEATSREPAKANTMAIPGTHQFLIMELVSHSEISYDNLVDALVPDRMSMGELSTALLMLELDGRVRQHPGRLYGKAL